MLLLQKKQSFMLLLKNEKQLLLTVKQTVYVVKSIIYSKRFCKPGEPYRQWSVQSLWT